MGPLGFPISNIQENKSTGVIFQQYEHGYIIGNDKYGYYESSGKIREVWVKQNYEMGPLGFPISEVLDNKNSILGKAKLRIRIYGFPIEQY